MFYNVEHEHREGFGEAFRDMPDVDPLDFDKVRRQLNSHYIFYRKEGSRRRGFCTCCGNEMYAERSHIDSGDFLEDLWRAKHRSEGRCPCCGHEVRYLAEGFYRDKPCNVLENYENVIFIIPADDGQTVYFRCFTVFSDFSTERVSRMCFIEKAHYKLTPTSFDMERRTFPIYDIYAWNTLAAFNGHYDVYNLGPWEPRKSICEPWQPYMYYYPLYFFYNIDALDGTFMKYHHLQEFGQINPCSPGSVYTHGSTKLMSYLCYYAKYPSLEIALRTGADNAVQDLVYLGLKNARVLNWKAKTPLEFYGVSKEEWKVISKLPDKFKFLKCCKGNLHRIPLEELVALYKENDSLGCENFFRILELLPTIYKPQKVFKYCRTYSNQYYGFYKDYLEMAVKLGRDLSVHNVAFPKDLILAHDEAVAAYKVGSDAKLLAKHKKSHEKRCKLYNFADEDYFVRVAESSAEIVNEGNRLHHCVGGYVERHLTCKTTILFIREQMNPVTPLYTVEMRDGKPVQVHGDRNCSISGPAKVFYDKWLEWVAAGGGFTQNISKGEKIAL